MDGKVIPRPHFLDRELTTKCQRVAQLSAEVNSDLREIGQLTQEVPLLANRILRAANQSRAGTARTIDSAQQAAILLGANRVREIAEQLLRDVRHSAPPRVDIVKAPRRSARGRSA